MRRPLVAGNWKMNCDATEAAALIDALKSEKLQAGVEAMIAPTSVNLAAAVQATKDSTIEVAAQNMHQAASGAYTGEISAAMLKSVGVNTVILGHSERRAYFGEDEAQLAQKVDAALSAGMQVIFCFGEVCLTSKSCSHIAMSSRYASAILELFG